MIVGIDGNNTIRICGKFKVESMASLNSSVRAPGQETSVTPQATLEASSGPAINRDELRAPQRRQEPEIRREVDVAKETFDKIAASSGGTVTWTKNGAGTPVEVIKDQEGKTIASRDPITQETVLHQKNGAQVAIAKDGGITYSAPPRSPDLVSDAAVVLGKVDIKGIPIHRTAAVGSGSNWQSWGFNPETDLTAGNFQGVRGVVADESNSNSPAQGNTINWYMKTSPEEDRKIIEKVQKELIPSWNGSTYRLVGHNCGDFTDAFRKVVTQVTGREWGPPVTQA